MTAHADWTSAIKKSLSEHEELRLAVDRLRIAASAPGGVISKGRLRELLAEEIAYLSEQLEAHFANEEGGSFLGVEGHRELGDTLERLKREHQEFREQARSLHLALSNGQDAGVCDRIVSLLDWLVRHEREENRMLQEALLRNSGDGD